MKFSKKISILLLACSASLVACKKDNTDLRTASDGLAGSWLLQQQGSDLNKNNQFDTEEKNKVTDSAKISYQFLKGGKGYFIGANNNFVDSLTWELTNNESVLHLLIDDKGFLKNKYYKFDVVTNALTLRDTTITPAYFWYLERKN